MESGTPRHFSLTDVSAKNDICPIADLAEIFSARWMVDVLLVLGNAERPLRFNELQRMLAPVSTKVLVQRLRGLERDGFLTHERFAQMPPRSEYSLTPLGISLWPVLDQLLAWMQINRMRVDQSRDEYDRSGKRLPA